MMSVAILEDDQMTTDVLISTLKEVDKDIEVVATLKTVEEAIYFFQSTPAVDLILSDVQLSDGLSFSVFESVEVNAPIIFISAYDQYIVNAYEFSGIDYLLKPASRESLKHSIRKYKTLQHHFLNRNGTIRSFLQNHLTNKKTRIIVKKGHNFISLLLDDVVLFYTENLLVFAVDQQGNKFLVDKNLNALEEDLDSNTFFRANRQYILNVNFILGYKSYERVKLLVTLKKEMDHVIIIGQEKAKAFRKWIAEV